MRLADVVGHEGVLARLRRAAAAERLASAYLLTGPPGIGKRLVADAFAARILCSAPVASDACQACPQCTCVAAGTHPDLRIIEREEERRDIRIEQVRELARWLTLQPLMAQRKVAIIDAAHCLSEPAQNALLKTLEEPPPSAVLLLTATAAARLLPTVRSRCQTVRMDPLPSEAVVRVLGARGVAPEQAILLAAESEGSPGRALALAGDEESRARTAILSALPELGRSDAAALSMLAQELSRGPIEAALSTAAAWYRDVLESALTGDPPRRNPDAVAAVRAVADRSPPTRTLRQLEVVCDTIDGLSRNANRVLALETMLLALRALERDEAPDVRQGST